MPCPPVRRLTCTVRSRRVSVRGSGSRRTPDRTPTRTPARGPGPGPSHETGMVSRFLTAVRPQSGPPVVGTGAVTRCFVVVVVVKLLVGMGFLLRLGDGAGRILDTGQTGSSPVGQPGVGQPSSARGVGCAASPRQSSSPKARSTHTDERQGHCGSQPTHTGLRRVSHDHGFPAVGPPDRLSHPRKGRPRPRIGHPSPEL